MSTQTDNLHNLVKPYGLSSDESRVYLFLLENGFTTALQLSRGLHMGRTKVYRLLDVLKEKQLVEYSIGERGISFGATHPSKFEYLVKEKEVAVESLRSSLPSLVSQLTNLSLANKKESKVLYYEGIEGLKQITHNMTRADKMLRVFEMEDLSDFMPYDFAERIRQKFVDNKIFVCDLTNRKIVDGYTDVIEMVENYHEYRYISPKKLKINFEVAIYNDVYTTYSYRDKQIFGVEIYNEQLAEMQKQLFDFTWASAQKMKVVDARGGARIK